MMGYKATRKVEATFFVDVARTETTTIIQNFIAFGMTMDEARKSLTEQVERYTCNPYMIKVVPISEYFENV